MYVVRCCRLRPPVPVLSPWCYSSLFARSLVAFVLSELAPRSLVGFLRVNAARSSLALCLLFCLCRSLHDRSSPPLLITRKHKKDNHRKHKAQESRGKYKNARERRRKYKNVQKNECTEQSTVLYYHPKGHEKNIPLVCIND